MAELYEVETGALNRAIKRNTQRFPDDFAFQITQKEWESLRFQFGTSNKGRGGRRYMPFAFTEHGVVMAANLLKSERAIAVSVEIVRTFIKLRELLSSHKEIAKQLVELKSFLLKHSNSNDREFRKVWQAIEKLSQPPSQKERQIGFDLS
ncbi:MAG: ORF6N domain-containing protein [Patescibacteria group bacterium]